MQLATYIKDLLYRYECVIIPGFGAFLTQYRAAQIDDNHTFYPPGKTLSFNRQLQTNDGILAHYVASVEACSYEVALQRIRNFAGELSLKLSEGETIELKNIGEFCLNNERKIQFIPSLKDNYSKASFGLSSFASPLIERTTEERPSKVVALKPEKGKVAIPYMRYAAVGLLAITLGSLSGLKIYENQVEKYNFAEKQKADALVENQIQEATFVIDAFPPLTLSIPKEKGKYHLVAGAFRVEENALNKVQQLQEKGFSAKLLGVNKYGLHQVIYNSYQDRLEAIKALQQIQLSENKEAWLLVQDLSE
ncbi:MAG: SPOR domain-containing protein [Flavobacteriaceae bacterium]|nr:SPOR domain-containing protein [Flavobacteriaceae bacterium]